MWTPLPACAPSIIVNPSAAGILQDRRDTLTDLQKKLKSAHILSEGELESLKECIKVEVMYWVVASLCSQYRYIRTQSFITERKVDEEVSTRVSLQADPLNILPSVMSFAEG